MQKIYIFDLDGTLALIDHRRPILDNKENPHRWDDFYRACVHDKPNQPVVSIFELLLAADHDIMIFSGRSQLVIFETVEWLIKNINWPFNSSENIKEWIYARLLMREIGDFTPDEILKKKWFDILDVDRKFSAVVFDDRDKVVKMWRDNGITCFQVAEGDF